MHILKEQSLQSVHFASWYLLFPRASWSSRNEISGTEPMSAMPAKLVHKRASDDPCSGTIIRRWGATQVDAHLLQGFTDGLQYRSIKMHPHYIIHVFDSSTHKDSLRSMQSKVLLQTIRVSLSLACFGAIRHKMKWTAWPKDEASSAVRYHSPHISVPETYQLL